MGMHCSSEFKLIYVQVRKTDLRPPYSCNRRSLLELICRNVHACQSLTFLITIHHLGLWSTSEYATEPSGAASTLRQSLTSNYSPTLHEKQDDVVTESEHAESEEISLPGTSLPHE
jgi:hypothetical protein